MSLQRVEGVGKIQLHEHVISWHCLKISTSRVNGSLTTARNANAQLMGIEGGFQLTDAKTVGAL